MPRQKRTRFIDFATKPRRDEDELPLPFNIDHRWMPRLRLEAQALGLIYSFQGGYGSLNGGIHELSSPYTNATVADWWEKDPVVFQIYPEEVWKFLRERKKEQRNK